MATFFPVFGLCYANAFLFYIVTFEPLSVFSVLGASKALIPAKLDIFTFFISDKSVHLYATGFHKLGCWEYQVTDKVFTNI